LALYIAIAVAGIAMWPNGLTDVARWLTQTLALGGEFRISVERGIVALGVISAALFVFWLRRSGKAKGEVISILDPGFEQKIKAQHAREEAAFLFWHRIKGFVLFGSIPCILALVYIPLWDLFEEIFGSRGFTGVLAFGALGLLLWLVELSRAKPPSVRPTTYSPTARVIERAHATAPVKATREAL
jgi:hypothetical protein